MKRRRDKYQLPALAKSASVQQTPQPYIPPRPYFNKSMKLIEDTNGYSNGRLCIDQAFGDYRMGLFRVKQRMQLLQRSESMITQELTSFCEAQIPSNLISQFKQIIKKPNDQIKKDNPQTDENAFQKQCSKWIGEQNQHLSHRYTSDHQRKEWFLPQFQKNDKIELIKETSEKKEEEIVKSKNIINRRKLRNKPLSVFMFRYQNQQAKSNYDLLKRRRLDKI